MLRVNKYNEMENIMRKQVYNLKNIRDRSGIFDPSNFELSNSSGRITHKQIRDLGWTILWHTDWYNGRDVGGSSSVRHTEYVLYEPKVEQWLKDNNIKIRKSSVWFEEEELQHINK